ncbi:MAG: hypothetical protein WCO89_03895 [Syntrophus sp. (in: bacteria)]
MSGYNHCEIGKTRMIRTLDFTKIYQVVEMAVLAYKASLINPIEALRYE